MPTTSSASSSCVLRVVRAMVQARATCSCGILNALETEHAVEEFEREQLERCLRREACPDGDEASPQAEDSVILDGLDETVGESVVDLLVSWLAHELGANHVPWCDRARHEESSDEGTGEGGADILSGPASLLGDESLADIVDAHLCGIEDAGAGDVNLDSAVKAPDALILVHATNECGERDGSSFVGLRKRLENIEWISDAAADAARDRTRNELDVERRLLSRAKHVTNCNTQSAMEWNRNGWRVRKGVAAVGQAAVSMIWSFFVDSLAGGGSIRFGK
mmetsp:Transcript_10004/g.27356  ORF Transcript_10004/g.27356 Transcript_10004/m.27356 type:complete len:279 (+) Transcript_10004:384-1220(+)